ncbi:MAG: 50S ribosomal protein L4 [Candidatus Magasanikbacteria bacterium]|nr:50S ribosomal protein L4 [Candidatus Magasanikbacteria bacterium]
MTKVSVYNNKGEQAGELSLNDAIFGLTPKEGLVQQVYLAQRANAREAWADTKDRSEVRGGGRKPWKQKGTGRARHGSNRSPIWTGGGVTFGPLSARNFKQKINKKMKRKATVMALSNKVILDKFIVLEDFAPISKTKDMLNLLSKMPGFGRTMLFISADLNRDIILSTRNIKKVDVQRAIDVNIVDLMHHQYIVTTKAGVEALEKRLS